MAIKLECPLTNECRLPTWLKAILEFQSERVGQDLYVDMQQSKLTFSGRKSIARIVFPHVTDHPVITDAIFTDGSYVFKSSLSRTCEVIDGATAATGSAWHILMYGEIKLPLFYFYKGDLVINATFGGANLTEYTSGGRRRKTSQPENPGSIIFRDFGLVLDAYLVYLAGYKGADEAKRWAQFRSGDLKKAISKLDTDIATNQRDIDNYNHGIRRALDKIRTLDRLRIGTEAELRNPTQYVEEYAKLEELCVNMYGGVAHSDTNITLLTQPIIMKDIATGLRYRMGRYKIVVNVRDGRLKVTNLDDFSHRSMCHPHVNTGGDPCLGNLSATLPELIKRGEIIPALGMIYEWVCGFNGADAYFQMRDAPGFDANGRRLSAGETPTFEDQRVCAKCSSFFLPADISYCVQCDNMVCANCLTSVHDVILCSTLCIADFELDNDLSTETTQTATPPSNSSVTAL